MIRAQARAGQPDHAHDDQQIRQEREGQRAHLDEADGVSSGQGIQDDHQQDDDGTGQQGIDHQEHHQRLDEERGRYQTARALPQGALEAFEEARHLLRVPRELLKPCDERLRQGVL